MSFTTMIKQTPENVALYITAVEAFAGSTGTLGVLDGTTPKPTLPPPFDAATITAVQLTLFAREEKAYENWMKHDGLNRVLLINSLHESSQHFVAPRLTSAQIWTSIKDHFKSLRVDRGIIIFRYLTELRMATPATPSGIAEYISKVRTWWPEVLDYGLTELKVTFPFQFIVQPLLHYLGPEFAVDVALLRQKGISLTIDELTTMLGDFASRLSINDSVLAESAMVASSHTTSATAYRPASHPARPRHTCTHCGKAGHDISRCWSKPKVAALETAAVAIVAPVISQLPLLDQLNFIESGFMAMEEIKLGEKHRIFTGHTRGQPSGVTSAALDTGATRSIFGDKRVFQSLSPIARIRIKIANGSIVNADQVGTVVVRDQSGSTLTIVDALYVPCLKGINLLSVLRIIGTSGECVFRQHSSRITSHEGHQLTGFAANGLHYLEVILNPPIPSNLVAGPAAVTAYHAADMDTWHRRFGHLNETSSRALLSGDIKLNPSKLSFCVPCQFGKSSRAIIPSAAGSVPSTALGRVSTDVCGPFQTATMLGYHYFVTFGDHHSRFVRTYLIKKKSDVFNTFLVYKARVEKETGLKIIILRSDRGGEYMSKEFLDYLDEHGIQKEMPAAYTPEQNGLAERINRTIVERVKTMLYESGLPLSYWGEAVLTATYLGNISPHAGLGGKSPRAVFSSFSLVGPYKPQLNRLRPFGCIAYVHVPKQLRKKLDDRVRAGVMLGYEEGSYSYRIGMGQGKVAISRNVVFNESHFPFFGNERVTLTHLNALLDFDALFPGAFNHLEVASPDSTPAPMPAPPPATADAPASSLIPFPVPNLPDQPIPDALSDAPVDPRTSPSPPPASSPPLSPVQPVNDIPRQLPAVLPLSPAPLRRSTRLVAARTTPTPAASIPLVDSSSEDDDHDGDESDDPLRLGPPVHSSKSRHGQWAAFAHHVRDFSGDSAFSATSLLVESANPDSPLYSVAMEGSHAEEWKAACLIEFTQLVKKGTGTMVVRPAGARVMGGKWVLTTKRDENGVFLKRKARWVAQGFTQIAGIDYSDTFASVGRTDTLRHLFACAALQSWSINQFDVASAFLEGDIDVDGLLIVQPKGFEELGRENYVWELKKPLYGLKQGPRCWKAKLDIFLTEAGFIASDADDCLYIHHLDNDTIHLFIHVDDGLLFSNSPSALAKFRLKLEDQFTVKYDENPVHFLGYGIKRNLVEGTIAIDQRAHLAVVLATVGLTDCTPTTTPLRPNTDLSPASDDEFALARSKPYRPILGALTWVTIGSRPDLTNTIHMLSQSMAKWSSRHWEALLYLLRYVKGTLDYSLVYRRGVGNGTTPIIFVDANWAADPTTRRSTSGFVILLAGAAISWASKRQPTVALSTAEAEYMAIGEVAKHVIWSRRLGSAVGFPTIGPSIIFGDNQSSIFLASNPTDFRRSKHIDIRHHFIREKVESKELELVWIPSQENISDILTKPLFRVNHYAICARMGLQQVS